MKRRRSAGARDRKPTGKELCKIRRKAVAGDRRDSRVSWLMRRAPGDFPCYRREIAIAGIIMVGDNGFEPLTSSM